MARNLDREELAFVNVETGELTAPANPIGADSLEDILFSPDSRLLATATDGEAQVWRLG